MLAKLLAAAHSVALDLAAVAASFIVGKAAGIYAEHAVAPRHKVAQKFAVKSDVFRRAAAQSGRIFEYCQYALISCALHTDKQKLIFCINSKHLISLLCHYARSLIVKAGFIYADIPPVTPVDGSVFLEVCLKRSLIELIKHIVYGLFAFFFLILVPLAFNTYLSRALSSDLIHDLIDYALREHPLSKPLVSHGRHSCFYVSITKVFDCRNACVDNEVVNCGQYKKYHDYYFKKFLLITRFFLLRLGICVFLFGAFVQMPFRRS
ncbi:unknown [Firmicutes bacterium CAG:240]|nr:unknown [Firmicutes bacterium CAG:240]